MSDEAREKELTAKVVIAKGTGETTFFVKSPKLAELMEGIMAGVSVSNDQRLYGSDFRGKAWRGGSSKLNSLLSTADCLCTHDYTDPFISGNNYQVLLFQDLKDGITWVHRGNPATPEQIRKWLTGLHRLATTIIGRYGFTREFVLNMNLEERRVAD
jgi:hypothetical protein